VIELHVEPLDKARREFMYRRRDRVHVAVTYRAHHLLLGVGELADVTSNARVVTGVFQIVRCSLTTVTRGALEFFMLWYFVRESFKSPIGRTDRYRIRRLGTRDRHGNLLLLSHAANQERHRRAEDNEGFQIIL
jgi:hypothetical protein